MVVITDKLNNTIVGFGDRYSYNELETHILVNDTYYQMSMFNVYLSVIDVPSDVEITLWCYTKDEGFYKYEDPDSLIVDEYNEYNIPDKIYKKILDDYTAELIEDGVIS